jgi:hypothetical protein
MEDEVVQLIEKEQWELLAIRKRADVFSRFVAEAHRVTRGAPAFIWNDLLYLTLLDSRDMVFVALADWSSVQTYKRRGLFTKLHATYSPRMFRRKRKSAADESYRSRDDDEKSHAAQYKRVFPGAGAHATKDDIASLRDRFRARFDEIHTHRNKNIAHVRLTKLLREVRPAMLGTDAAIAALDYAMNLYNDLSNLLGGASFMGKDPPSRASRVTFAEQLVDDVLLHPLLARQTTVHRNAVYDELHRRHTEEPKRFFNLDPLLDWPELGGSPLERGLFPRPRLAGGPTSPDSLS